jgi:hypothetical protein
MQPSRSETLETLLGSYHQDLITLNDLVPSYGELGQNMDMRQMVAECKKIAERLPDQDWNSPEFVAELNKVRIESFSQRFGRIYDPEARIEHSIRNTGSNVVAFLEDKKSTLQQKAHAIATREDEAGGDPYRYFKALPPVFERALAFIDTQKPSIKPEEQEKFAQFRAVVAIMLETVKHSNQTRAQIRQALGFDAAPTPDTLDM